MIEPKDVQPALQLAAIGFFPGFEDSELPWPWLRVAQLVFAVHFLQSPARQLFKLCTCLGSAAGQEGVAVDHLASDGVARFTQQLFSPWD